MTDTDPLQAMPPDEQAALREAIASRFGPPRSNRRRNRRPAGMPEGTYRALQAAAAIVKTEDATLDAAAQMIGMDPSELQSSVGAYWSFFDAECERYRGEPKLVERGPAADFDPDEMDPDEIPEGRLSSQMTLGEFFRKHAWPFILRPKGDSLRTLRDYQTSLKKWAQVTGNPPLAAITQATCVRYIGALRDRLGANTVFKHWMNVERLLRWTGPAGPQNKLGTDLIERPPWIQGPTRRRAAPKQAFDLGEIWTWLQALPRFARPWPQIPDFDPADWWRAAIVVAYNTAMRPGLQFRTRWDWFEREHVMRIPVGVAKGHDGRRVYFNRAAVEVLKPLRQPRGPIFGWDFSRAYTTFRKYIWCQQRDAGLPENRRLPWYALRRTFATQMAQVNLLAMQIVMNHSGLGTKMAIEHYIDEEPLVMDALSKLPQPGSLRAVGQKCA